MKKKEKGKKKPDMPEFHFKEFTPEEDRIYVEAVDKFREAVAAGKTLQQTYEYAITNEIGVFYSDGYEDRDRRTSLRNGSRLVSPGPLTYPKAGQRHPDEDAPKWASARQSVRRSAALSYPGNKH
jgi:hypothetical protein